MKLNKKGFTLVELLAVIVVLAIIALIGFGAVGPIIEDSRMNAAVSSATNYASKVSEECMRLWVNDGATTLPAAADIDKSATDNMTGTKPTDGATAFTVSSNCAITWKATATESNKVVTVTSGITVNGYKCGYNSTKSAWQCKK